jgi:hypothetical protein
MAGTAMSPPPLVKVTAGSPLEVCARVDLPKEAKALLRDGMGVREFVDALLASKQYVAGIDFMAHALPPREGIWWGCLCLQHAVGSGLSPVERAACIAAVQWVLRPGEETRAAARPPAEAAGPANPAGSLAAAAFQTGGNVAPPNAPPMAPPPFAYAKAVATAVKLASIKAPPVKLLETQRAYVELGIGLAEGRYI